MPAAALYQRKRSVTLPWNFAPVFCPSCLNSEVDEYLKSNDIIIVPVGTVEMHGGLPLDSETVISELSP